MAKSRDAQPANDEAQLPITTDEPQIRVELQSTPGVIGQIVETIAQNAEAATNRTPRDPDRCIVVRTVPESKRAYCSVDHGSRVVEEFRVNGEVPENAENILSAFAASVALQIAQKAQTLDIEVVRVSNAKAGAETAVALREAGFYVVEFPG